VQITGLNGGADNSLTMSTTTVEEREKWCKTIRRSVNRIHIDQGTDREGCAPIEVLRISLFFLFYETLH
jgi:hypothetical protein